MKSLLTFHSSILFLVYPVGGLALGLADPLLGKWVQQLGLRPGLATAASVNIQMPLMAIGLGLIHQRVAGALLGAVGMAAAFLFGLAVQYPPPRPWDAAALLLAIPPVLVLACAGYAVLGSASALATRAFWNATR
jgi:hypothetical protein